MSPSGVLCLSLAEFADRSAVQDVDAGLSVPGPQALVLVSLDSGVVRSLPAVGARAAIVVGIDRAGETPADVAPAFDLLLTTREDAPAPWVGLAPARLEQSLAMQAERVTGQHMAAAVLVQVLRAGEGLAFDKALLLESLAYSTLQSGAAFRAWLQGQPLRAPRPCGPDVVRVVRRGDELDIVLTRPEVHNAFGARLRDALIEALQIAVLDASVRRIVLSGEGPSFCSGGDLREFGMAPDGVTGHFVRLQQSAAWLVHLLAQRLSVRVHGSCIGAGIEVAAAAGHVLAHRDTQFRLPEVGMGLIPGAGGTVSIARRIGRHRAGFMALTGTPIDAATALHWGLIDEVDRGP